MSETAVAEVHTVTVAPGVTISSNMTPTERYNAIAKVHGAPAAERPQGARFAAQGMTDATVAELARRDGRQPGTAPPAAPAKPQTPDPNAVANFDQEMRDKGLQSQLRDASGRFAVPPDQVDQAGIEALSKAYSTRVSELQRSPPSPGRDKLIEGTRALYQTELAEFYEGRKVGETRRAFDARKNGTAPTVPQPSQHTPQQWEEGHKSVTDAEGWIPMDRINANGLSGYTLPKLIEGQQYHKSVFSQLATAKAAGLTQEAVTAYITQQMKADGWIKS